MPMPNVKLIMILGVNCVICMDLAKNRIMMDQVETVVIMVMNGMIHTKAAFACGRTMPTSINASGSTMASIFAKSALVAFIKSD